LKSINPATEELISITKSASIEDYENALKGMMEAKAQWAKVPMPKRG
jgi:acyl-CoA reductase-like NAD-dependent aldehyde dehydrogenase